MVVHHHTMTVATFHEEYRIFTFPPGVMIFYLVTSILLFVGAGIHWDETSGNVQTWAIVTGIFTIFLMLLIIVVTRKDYGISKSVSLLTRVAQFASFVWGCIQLADSPSNEYVLIVVLSIIGLELFLVSVITLAFLGWCSCCPGCNNRDSEKWAEFMDRLCSSTCCY